MEQRSPTYEDWEMAFVCHRLINLISREALRELFETVVDIYFSYQIPYQETPALPPAATPKKAVYGGRVKSTPFIIEFDEG